MSARTQHARNGTLGLGRRLGRPVGRLQMSAWARGVGKGVIARGAVAGLATCCESTVVVLWVVHCLSLEARREGR